jgi:hypothetical protein
MELQRISDSLDQYLLLCAQEKVCHSASSVQPIVNSRNGKTAQ